MEQCCREITESLRNTFRENNREHVLLQRKFGQSIIFRQNQEISGITKNQRDTSTECVCKHRQVMQAKVVAGDPKNIQAVKYRNQKKREYGHKHREMVRAKISAGNPKSIQAAKY